MAAKKTVKKKQVKKRAKAHPVRGTAKVYYLTGEYTLKEISEILGVSENTLQIWKEEDRWEWERGIKDNASKEIISFLYEQILLLQETCIDKDQKKRPMNSKEADTVVKISNSIEKLSNRLSASTVMEAFVMLGNEIKMTDTELAKQLLPHQTEILKRMA